MKGCVYMNEIQNKFKKYIRKYIGNPYVWGGSGEVLTKSNYEAFIDAHEKNPVNAQRAKDFCKKLFDSGRKKLYVYDCSGYISKALMSCGLRTWRGDCDALWEKCTPTNEVRDFTLLFRVSSSNQEDETHVGTYFDGKQYHAKGRDDGVVEEPFDPNFWDKYGNYDGLNTYLSEHVFTKSLKNPMYNSSDVKELKKLLQANGLGLDLNVSNGNYLSRTKEIVMAFQRSYFDDPKEWDGIAGKKTITALKGIWGGK